MRHSVNGDEDDLIIFDIISNLGKQVKWKFPEMKHCPVRTCSIWFETRSLAIKHYREKHVENVVFCEVCDKLFHKQGHSKHMLSSFHRNAELRKNVN